MILSKAALRSRRMRILREPVSEDSRRSLVTFCTVFGAETGLEEFKEVVGVKVDDEVFGNNTFQDFRQKR